jgi:hypothetical protein
MYLARIPTKCALRSMSARLRINPSDNQGARGYAPPLLERNLCHA